MNSSIPLQATVAALVLAGLGTAGSGCATIVKGSQNELKIWGAPANLRAFADNQELQLVKGSTNRDGSLDFRAKVDKNAQKLNLRVDGYDLPVKLNTRLGAGWLIADIFLTFGVGCIVDAFTGRWKELSSVDVPEVMEEAKKEGTLVRAREGVQAALVEKKDDKKRSRDDDKKRDKQDDKKGRDGKSGQTALVDRSGDRDSGAIGERNSGRDDRNPDGDRSSSSGQTDSGASRGGPVIRAGKIAVLDFKSYAKDFKPEDVRYFTDLVRGSTLRAAPGLEVMTRENLLVLLQATGKTLDQCEGECEVDTGRRIGADAVISGDVLKVGSRFKMSLRLHETHGGRLLSTAVASGKTVDELDEAVSKAAEDLINPRR